MRKTRTVRTAGVLLVATMALGACSSSRSSSSSSSDSTGGSALLSYRNCPADTGTAGVNGDTITLASSFPQSGLTAAFAEISKGYKAYFQYVNEEQGGVEVGGKKYKIEVKDKDDKYNAATTASNIEQLVGSDGTKAFAVFNVVGTSNNIAIRDTLADLCVPNVFAATGSPAMSNPKYPWTIGSTLPPYTLEGVLFADYLKKNFPKAKVAMLVQDDDFGQDYQGSFERAIKGSEITLVKVEKYPVGANDVGPQMTSLAASGANAFFDGGTLLACPDALKKAQDAGWKRDATWVSGTCISKTLMGIAGDAGDKVLSATNTQDPQNPAYKNTPEMALYREKVAKYQPSADIENGIVAYGWTQGALLVEALKASKALSRVDFMNSVRNLNQISAGVLITGAKITTKAPDDLYMGETLQLVQYDAAEKHFNNVGAPSKFEGKTVSLTPAAQITQ